MHKRGPVFSFQNRRRRFYRLRKSSASRPSLVRGAFRRRLRGAHAEKR